MLLRPRSSGLRLLHRRTQSSLTSSGALTPSHTSTSPLYSSRPRLWPSSNKLTQRVLLHRPASLNRSKSTNISQTNRRYSSSNNLSNSPEVAAITALLNPAQKAAVLAPSPGISVCTAGPGSGKTRVLAHRVAHLLQYHRAPPTSVLALTFTNKAGQEMKSRIASLLASISPDYDTLSSHVTVGTFHAFCSTLLRGHGATLLPELTNNSAVDWDFSIYDKEDSLRVVKTLLSERNLSSSLKPNDVLRLISRRKTLEMSLSPNSSTPLTPRKHSFPPTNHSVTPYNPKKGAEPLDPYSGTTPARLYKPELEALHRDYTAALHSCNAVDFDDLLLLGWRLLRDYPEVRRRVQRRYKHVLVDEYQDTNLPQYQIIRLLYCDQYNFPPEEREEVANQNRTLFVVGDVNQAIYSWRGAVPSNMMRIAADYPTVATTFGLRENYRCSPSIAAAANALLGAEATVSINTTQTQSGSPSPPVQVIGTQDDAQQGLVIAEKMRSLAGSGKTRAVLYRTNAQSRQLEVSV